MAVEGGEIRRPVFEEIRKRAGRADRADVLLPILQRGKAASVAGLPNAGRRVRTAAGGGTQAVDKLGEALESSFSVALCSTENDAYNAKELGRRHAAGV